ncbi:AraC family transcriptional regulator [Chryseobacterium lactis]|uniref:AraC family transcriptional regulator n=1 Tax=Chryseobacterium lactis TaxID=1241981 RepID=A0A3G6RT62_CHRLC|nr:AraC family transcriptional regulator [Chryseobacterium lactis]AZA84755.1 AraC family transcriptional regulator [Chryseobacterium lactis]AZB05144.1 AraC family transcriptional regulator [Chryseobacterium lactis]PNW12126.1 AraC family transcriptional regulator [Chryseobacterium lactis]
MVTYENLHDTLSFYSIDCRKSYYVSSGNPIFKFPGEPFRMDYYALCICTAGEISIEIDNQNYKVDAHSFLVAAPSTIVKFLETSEDFMMKLLFFDKNFLIKNISNPFIIEKMNLFPEGSYSIVKTTAKNSSQLQNLLDYLKKKSRKQGKFTEEIIRTIIFNLLLETAEIIEKENLTGNEKEEGKKDLYLKFTKLIRENIRKQRAVQFYADQLCISNKYLIEIIKKTSGKTPHEVIDETLLKEAYVMLGNPEVTILEIAFELQFNSASAFGRFFKKHTSISPSEYRIKENIQS